MSIDVKKLSPALGAEISGVDLNRPLDAATVNEIHQAWLDHLVIVFRDQNLSEDDQIRFCRYLGVTERYPHRIGKDTLAENPDTVLIIGNVKKDGKVIGSLPDGELTMHADSLWLDMPPKGTTLFAIDVPKTGGETFFADMYAAYDLLSPDIKARLAGKMAVFDYNVGARYVGDSLGAEDSMGNTHPAVVTHAETGRKLIFVNPLMTKKILGVSPEESEALLEACYAAAATPSIQYLHSWRKGDFLMWDNRCTQHGRRDFDPNERRLMKRVTISGDMRPAMAA